MILGNLGATLVSDIQSFRMLTEIIRILFNIFKATNPTPNSFV